MGRLGSNWTPWVSPSLTLGRKNSPGPFRDPAEQALLAGHRHTAEGTDRTSVALACGRPQQGAASLSPSGQGKENEARDSPASWIL